MGWVGNNSWTHPPFFSRHLTLQNLRNIIFLDFSIFDALDACLMVHGSWLKAHGSWPREARGGSWLMARCLPGPGDWTIKHASRTSNIEKSRKWMFLKFCKVRCREKKGGWVQELFPTHPTYQNPINMNPGPLLCKVCWFFGYSVFWPVFVVFFAL